MMPREISPGNGVSNLEVLRIIKQAINSPACRIPARPIDLLAESDSGADSMTRNQRNLKAVQIKNEYPWTPVRGDWLLCPSSMAFAGAWIVWIVCTIGSYCLRSDLPYRGGAMLVDLASSSGIGAMLAIPLVVTAVIMRRTGSQFCPSQGDAR
jgi:hypothetical protein